MKLSLHLLAWRPGPAVRAAQREARRVILGGERTLEVAHLVVAYQGRHPHLRPSSMGSVTGRRNGPRVWNSVRSFRQREPGGKKSSMASIMQPIS